MMRLSLKRAARRLGYRSLIPNPSQGSLLNRSVDKILNTLTEMRKEVPSYSPGRERLIKWASWCSIIGMLGLIPAILAVLDARSTAHRAEKILEITDTVVKKTGVMVDSLISVSMRTQEILKSQAQITTMLSFIYKKLTQDERTDIANQVPQQERPSMQRIIDRAQTAIDSGDYQAAESLYSQLAQISPSEGYFYLNLGYARFMLADFNGAVEAWQKGLNAATERAPNAYNLGMFHAMRQDYETARRYYQTAVENDPELCEAYFHLGDIALILRDFDHVKGLLDSAVACNPALQRNINEYFRTRR